MNATLPRDRPRSARRRVAAALVATSTLAALLCALGPAARAARQTTALTATRVRVELQGAETSVSGGRLVRVGAVMHVEPGTSDRTYVSRRAYQRAPLCSATAGSPGSFDDARLGAGPHADDTHLWTAEVRLVSVEADRLVLDVDWKHYARSGANRMEQVAGDHSTIKLREGSPQVLDFIRGNDLDRSVCHLANTTIELVANIEDAPPLTDEVLSYDAWILQENARGERTTGHARASARQGETTGFAFKPLRWDVERTGCTLYTQVLAYVSAQIRGRVRSDGRIDIVLRPQRDITRLGDTPRAEEVGEKTFTVSSGEAVTFVLPPPSGGGGSGFPCKPIRTPQSPLPPGVTLITPPGSSLGPLLRVDLAQFLAGEKTSIVVTANRAGV